MRLFPSPLHRYITAMHEGHPLQTPLAARRAGADAADALLVERTSMAVTRRLGGLGKLERQDARAIGLRLLLVRRVANAEEPSLQLLQRRALVPGSDPELHGSIDSPTVRIDDLTVAGA